MSDKAYKMVMVHRGDKSYVRKQPLHHRINRKILKRELARLKEEKAVVEENMRAARRRALG